MALSGKTHRRGFLGGLSGIVGAAAAFGVTGAQRAEAQQGGPDDWIKGVKGTHRCLFDFPQFKNGMPLLHILNYLNTYGEAYKAPGTAGAVGTFYSMGPQASIPFAFNDAMWAKYKLGEYTGLKDTSGKPYTRNVFYRPTPNELHLVMDAIQSPTIPAFAGALPAIGIESLQKMGTTFLLCANAFGGWCEELSARGKGKSEDLMKDLGANILPGVITVPAMVIAIEKAQGAGIAYNRQWTSATSLTDRRFYENRGDRTDDDARAGFELVRTGERVIMFHQRNPDIDIVMSNEAYKARYNRDNPNIAIIHALKQAGVDLRVCGQGLIGRKIDPNQVNPDVQIDLWALTTLVNLQLKGYVRVG